ALRHYHDREGRIGAPGRAVIVGAVGGAGDAVGHNDAGAVVETPTPEQAGSRGDFRTHGALDLRLAARVIPDAHLINVAGEKTAGNPQAIDRGANARMLNASVIRNAARRDA